MPGSEPSVRIKLSDIYRELLEIKRTVAPIPGLVEDNTDHEKRIRSLERFSWKAAGALTLAAGSVGSILTWVLTTQAA